MFEELSKRELEVMELLSHGYSYDDIQALLGFKACTMRTHMNSIYEKLADIIGTCKRDSTRHSKRVVVVLLYLRYKGVLDKNWDVKV